MMLGALLASLGMVASSFSSTLGQLYFTAGFITGLLLDATNNFSYLFYLSTFILVLTALFMGGSFYVLQKREQGRQSKAQGDTPKDKDTPEKQLCPENTNVTNL
ncbi:monocarboxylate transporter 6 isoform X3 [Ochotona curzoniae]|uniref:monocarboxylate transporter 6 isoform X3 n=1 Tax=Ochotona curzoniae TaxID=130825 RepID=UPI001B34E3E0|nr:monocarboxylate transporter 6 isoform X3 [Ochotona curzoniae]